MQCGGKESERSEAHRRHAAVVVVMKTDARSDVRERCKREDGDGGEGDEEASP